MIEFILIIVWEINILSRISDDEYSLARVRKPANFSVDKNLRISQTSVYKGCVIENKSFRLNQNIHYKFTITYCTVS